jgi:hypothetical protein
MAARRGAKESHKRDRPVPLVRADAEMSTHGLLGWATV